MDKKELKKICDSVFEEDKHALAFLQVHEFLCDNPALYSGKKAAIDSVEGAMAAAKNTATDWPMWRLR